MAFKGFLAHWRKGLIIIGLLALMVLATGCAAAAGAANEPQPRTITVTGTGEASGTPDIAYVDLGVSVQGPDLSRVIDEANKTSQNITDALIGAGVEQKDITTSGFSVWLEEVRDDRGNLVGQTIYHVDSTVQVKVRAIDSTGDVIGAALEAGANRVNNLWFSIDDSTALVDSARAAAIEDAAGRAQILADGFGVRLGKPMNITEGQIGGPVTPKRVDMMAAEGMGGGAGYAPPINTGEQSVQMQVYVTYELLP